MSHKFPLLIFNSGQPTASVIRSPIEGEETKSEEFLTDPMKPQMPILDQDKSKKKQNKPANKPRKSAKKEKKTERSVRTRTATFEVCLLFIEF